MTAEDGHTARYGDVYALTTNDSGLSKRARTQNDEVDELHDVSSPFVQNPPVLDLDLHTTLSGQQGLTLTKKQREQQRLDKLLARKRVLETEIAWQ